MCTLTERHDPEAALGAERDQGRAGAEHVRGDFPRAGDGSLHAVFPRAARPPLQAAGQQHPLHYSHQNAQGRKCSAHRHRLSHFLIPRRALFEIQFFFLCTF